MKRLLFALPLWTACVRADSSAPTVPPEISRQADVSVLAAPNKAYVFRIFECPSADGLRRYRVFVGIPKIRPPKGGFPVWYALDGNALLEYLNPENLDALVSAGDPPVLVLVGYATDRRFDTAARAYDYTPPDLQGKPMPDRLDSSRNNGGAAGFLDLLAGAIRHQAERGLPIDGGRRTLWGHSYGGVFVLYALSVRPAAFDRYVAADPSLWLQDGLVLRYTGRLSDEAAGKRLVIQKSGRREDRKPANPQQAARLAERERALSALPPDAAERLAQGLRQKGVKVRYRLFADLNHGQVLAASFMHLLKDGEN